MTDPIFRGLVLADALPGGTAAADITIFADHLEARLNDDRPFALRFAGMRVERGGASGDLIFCRPAAGGATIACEARGFLAALSELAGPVLGDDLRRLSAKGRGVRRLRVAVLATTLAVIAVVALALPLLWSWCVERAVAAIPTSVDRTLGDHVKAQTAIATPAHPQAAAALRAIVDRLAAAAPAGHGFEFRVEIAGDDAVNAFAAPGGFMVVNRGLLAKAESADQIAGVLAHEMAHVLRRHGMRGLVNNAGLVLVMQAAFGDVGGLSATLAEGATLAVLSKHSRDQERDADAEGVRLLVRAGLDPNGVAGFFRLLQREPGSEATGLAGWMASHPGHAERIATVEHLARELAPVELRPLAIDWAAVRTEAGK